MKNITILDMEIAAGQLYVVFFSCFNFHSFQPITMNEIVLTNVLINQSIKQWQIMYTENWFLVFSASVKKYLLQRKVPCTTTNTKTVELTNR